MVRELLTAAMCGSAAGRSAGCLRPLARLRRIAVPAMIVSQRRCAAHVAISTTGQPNRKRSIFSESVVLPSTDFPMQSNHEKREKLFRKRTTTELYRWQAEQKDRPLYVLHDGPPYANGEIHMGHALNKILKDIAIRYQVMQGKRVHYHPGWDCHGLPIELKTIQSSQFHGIKPRDIAPLTVRKAAREYAAMHVQSQMDRFKEFAMMADWSAKTTYKTFDKEYELRQISIFREMVKRGLVYRAHRPVYWSPSSRTALAESELEYRDNELFVRSMYCRFDLEPGSTLQDRIDKSGLQATIDKARGVTLPIWTTTAWTLPSNMAVNVNPDLEYGLYRAREGPLKDEVFVLACDRVEKFSDLRVGLISEGGSGRATIGLLDVLTTFPGTELLDSSYRHAFQRIEDGPRPIVPASYVSAETGTGLVHSAPGHGQEDWLAWKAFLKTHPQYAEEVVPSPVDDTGSYTSDIISLVGLRDGEPLVGQRVMKAGVGALIGLSHRDGRLICEQPVNQHRTPCDWRTHEPVLTRMTSQWFANLEPIKEAALKALEKVRFVPEAARPRLESMLRARNEWCISRQRSWGVPIPALYDVENGNVLLSETNIRHIEGVLAEKGIDYWWQGDAEEFVAPSERKEGRTWLKGTDTVDVWFDSGSSWNTLPTAQEAQEDPSRFVAPKEPVADLYMEGTDQHRGWFQSSLLTYIATSTDLENPSAPYKTLATHGFTVDKKSQKMSKSIGNVIMPSFFLEGGAKRNEPARAVDAVRMWAARANYTTNVIVSPLVVKHAAEAMFPFRNQSRYLLSIIPKDPAQRPRLEEQELGLIEKYVLDDLHRLETTCKQAYEDLDFRTVTRAVAQFLAGTASSTFVELSKDLLYSSKAEDPVRQSIVAVMDQALRTIMTLFAPIMPHLAEEVYHYYKGATQDPSTKPDSSEDTESVFKLGWQSVPDKYLDDGVREEFLKLMHMRSAVMATMETTRARGLFKTTFQLDLDIRLGAGDGTTSTADRLATPLLKPGPRLEGRDKSKPQKVPRDNVVEALIDTARSLNLEPLPPADPDYRKKPVEDLLLKHKELLPRLFGVSHVRIYGKDEELVYDSGNEAAAAETKASSEVNAELEAQDAKEETPEQWVVPGQHLDCIFRIQPARGRRCPRCWSYRRAPGKPLCHRCEDVVRATHPHLLEKAAAAATA